MVRNAAQPPSTVPTLTTRRFVMRALRRSDAAALLPTLGDSAQCLYLSRPAFASEDELWGWLADPEWTGRSWIAEDEQGAVVGRFVAVPLEAERVEEIGYITCVGRQSEGVAKECTAALIAHLFGSEGADKLVAEVDVENVASVGLIERLGFTREALHIAHEETHKGVCDMAIYILHRNDYQVSQKAVEA